LQFVWHHIDVLEKGVTFLALPLYTSYRPMTNAKNIEDFFLTKNIESVLSDERFGGIY